MSRQPIVEILRTADRGQVWTDLQEGITQIVNAIEEQRGAGVGEITLKLRIKCPSEGVYEITPDLKVSVPKAKRLPMITFLDGQSGELIRRDPRQPDLPSVVEADELNRRRMAASQED